jgi:phage shock protein A
MDKIVAKKRTLRTYSRRTDDERLAELEQRLAELKAKQARQQKMKDPVLREAPKLQRKLKQFAQLALDNDRPDVANSVLAWNAQMERILQSDE